VSGSGIRWAICKSAVQTDNHTSTPPLSFLQAGCPSCRPTNSVKALKVKSTVDYIMVRQEDKAKARNSKVISSQKCVPKHKLLVMDMWLKQEKVGVGSSSQECVRVWKLKEEKDMSGVQMRG